jgi:hypothetical protein
MRGTERACLALINEVREWRSGIADVAYPPLTRSQLLSEVGSYVIDRMVGATELEPVTLIQFRLCRRTNSPLVPVFLGPLRPTMSPGSPTEMTSRLRGHIG